MFHSQLSLHYYTHLPLPQSAPFFLLLSAQRYPLQSAQRWTVWTICRIKPPRRLQAQRSCRGEQHGGYDSAFTIEERKYLGRLTSLARTSLPPLYHRTWIKDKILECFAALHAEERKCSPIKNLSLQQTKFCVKFIKISFQHKETCCDVTHTRESRAKIQKSLQESSCERERVFTEHREVREFLELQADHAAQRRTSRSIQTL